MRPIKSAASGARRRAFARSRPCHLPVVQAMTILAQFSASATAAFRDQEKTGIPTSHRMSPAALVGRGDSGRAPFLVQTWARPWRRETGSAGVPEPTSIAILSAPVFPVSCLKKRRRQQAQSLAMIEGANLSRRESRSVPVHRSTICRLVGATVACIGDNRPYT